MELSEILNIIGLWDNVSQTFFAPQGGTLIGGPNVI